MKFYLALALLCGVAALSASDKINHTNYKVVRVTPRQESHVQMLKDLQAMGVTFWDEPSVVGKSSDILLAPHQQVDLCDGLKNSGMAFQEYIKDVQALKNNEVVKTLRNPRDLTWDAYYRLADIYAWLDEQQVTHPDIVEIVTYGKSFEGRDLKLVKLSKSGDTKPIVFIEANIHAREWITNAVTTYILNQILNGNLGTWLDDFDFYVVPVTNPDGYEFTHTNDRLWRKTRSTTGSPLGCRGADPNRNWGYQWFTGGSSNNPCLDTFAGGEAFSEAEARLLAEYYNTVAPRVKFYFAIHSYSQYILIPYGYTGDHIPQYDEYFDVATRAANALSQRYGTQFIVGNIVDLLYPASGGSIDWVLGVHNTPLTLGAELRDTGNFGFLLPPNQIVPSSLELIDALQVFLDHVRTK